jgi:hypothetical protein
MPEQSTPSPLRTPGGRRGVDFNCVGTRLNATASHVNADSAGGSHGAPGDGTDGDRSRDGGHDCCDCRRVYEDAARRHPLGHSVGVAPTCVLTDHRIPDFEDCIPDAYPAGYGNIKDLADFLPSDKRWVIYFHYARQVYGVSGLGRRCILPPCVIRAIRRK